MADESLKFDVKEVKQDLQRAIIECSQRGLIHSTKWLSELNFALRDVKIDPSDTFTQSILDNDDEAEHYLLAKSYFDLKEYDRCAYFTEFCQAPRTRFLHLYSRYLSGEKKKISDVTDITTPPDPTQNSSLRELGSQLMKDHLARKLDGYGLYLYGIVLKRLELLREAVEVLVEATHNEPLHWGSWLELATLITDRTKLNSLVLPDHWMKHFFLGHTFLEQQLNEDALDIYFALQQHGFEKSTYLIAQTAIAFHNRRDVDTAITTFRRLQECDPFRLDNLDTYSNLLYVKELRVELADLAHKACEIDKYRVETCCVVGNYYSLRSEHQKAVLYFQRALKLNPQYLSAWTLMGHEFMEMKNTNAAIQSYRQAIEVNRRDYRAWYGLGQTYEILKMFFYCLYYYKQAQQLRPNDSRMLIALGETYEKLDKIPDALKCYYKARNVGDIEGTALLKLAKLYDKLNEFTHAAAAFTEYVNENEPRADKSEMSQAYKYLANYYVKRNQLDEAYRYAQKCLEFEETKEEGKALLRTIAQKRSQQEEGEMQVEEETASIVRVRPRMSDGTPNNQLTPMNLSFTL
ncbi:cell division cycle protein 23 homolog isoform X1 [Periplaneta americana]|uniref:cell division cycle protein 23 homolog isoform X1 n=1 Tax=Periplaneta americana TaxID=6978 RepID=UPI0037E851C8